MDTLIGNSAENHFYAKRTADGAEIHISEATSGRGYTCLGCSRDMQAVKHKKKPTDYFRHDSKYHQQNNKCTFSDYIYRRIIAIESLILEKRIKVPAIYKFNPRNLDAPPMLLRSADFIYADTVKRNLLFYEDTSGLVAMASELPSDGRILLFQPDVVFFQDEKPILLIQIVKKFTITEDNKTNLKRLQINTLQITLPQDSREAIYHSLFKLGRSQWIYTNEQQSTKYLQPSAGNSGRIESIDDFERRVHAESVTCRQNQIANLIRAIGKCYQSEPYIEVESRVGSRLRDERRTIEANRQRRIGLEAAIGAELEGTYKGELDRIAIGQSELNERGNEFSRNRTFAEKRYQEEAGQLENDYRTVANQTEEITELEQRAIAAKGKTELAYLRDERSISEHARDAELEFLLRLSELSELTNRVEAAIRRTVEEISSIHQRTEALSIEFRQLEISVREDSEREIKRIQREEECLPEWAGTEESKLSAEFAELRRQTDFAFESRDSSGTSQISAKLKTLYNQRAKLADIESIGRLIESIEKETYKNWLR